MDVFNRIEGNQIYSNGENGIFISSPGTRRVLIFGNKIYKNIISSNNGSGIHIKGNTGTKILENKIISNRKSGITIDSSIRSSIHKNIIYDNDDYGVYLYKSKYNKIVKNNFFDESNNAFFNFDEPFFSLITSIYAKFKARIYLKISGNKWDRNFWYDHQTGPMRIRGIIESWYYLLTNEYGAEICGHYTDLNPAQEPYDI